MAGRPDIRMVGYARVSTTDQRNDAQRIELERIGCEPILEDVISGMRDSRPQLDKVLGMLVPGDTLVVVRLDRLGRSLRHVFGVIDDLTTRGVIIRSLTEGLDTSTAQGRMMAQFLLVFAGYERELIVERTKAGLKAARARGITLGNDAFRRRDPIAIANMKATLDETLTQKVRKAAWWKSLVMRVRPVSSWKMTAAVVNRERGSRNPVTASGLRRACGRLVRAGDMPDRILERGQRRRDDDLPNRAKSIRLAYPEITLEEIGKRLLAAGHRPPRSDVWTSTGVKRLLEHPKRRQDDDPDG